MAVEFHSELSFRRFGFHEEHWDMDFVARPAERADLLGLLASLGFNEGKVIHQGLNGAGWIFARNNRGELAELCFTEALDDRMLAEDETTVPLWLIGVRLFGAPIMSENASRADDAIAFFLDHEPTEWRETPLFGPANEPIMATLVKENFSVIDHRLESLGLQSEARLIHERAKPIVEAILGASRRTIAQQARMLERWGFAPGMFVDCYPDEEWQPVADRSSEVWWTYTRSRGDLRYWWIPSLALSESQESSASD
jgi:hypothetical protein